MSIMQILQGLGLYDLKAFQQKKAFPILGFTAPYIFIGSLIHRSVIYSADNRSTDALHTLMISIIHSLAEATRSDARTQYVFAYTLHVDQV